MDDQRQAHRPEVEHLTERIDHLQRRIEHLRRLAEQQADEIKAAGKEIYEADSEIIAAHRALDAHTPRECNGRALSPAERIAAALPALPEPAGKWERKGVFLTRDINAFVAVWRWDTRCTIYINGRGYSIKEARAIEDALRLARGSAGVPPTTEPTP